MKDRREGPRVAGIQPVPWCGQAGILAAEDADRVEPEPRTVSPSYLSIRGDTAQRVSQCVHPLLFRRRNGRRKVGPLGCVP